MSVAAPPIQKTGEGTPGLMVAAGVAAGLVLELVLLALWQRNGYWEFSDGVYAQSAREFLHGMVPYRDFAAGQPPLVFLVGAVLLAIHDGVATLRVGAALADLGTAVLVGLCVWRLTGLRAVAVATGLLSPLLPISLHEHAQLTPETFAAPLLLAGALLCARPHRAGVGGFLLALAVMCKLPFALPALSTRQRREATLTLILAVVVFASASVAAFGNGVWRDAVHAQSQVGLASLHYVSGLIAQGAWNELPLVLPAAAGVWLVWTHREQPLDMELMRTLVAATLAGLLLALTVFKRGSWINVLVVAEPPLLVLAAAGAVWSARASRAASIAIGLLGVLLAAQIVSLLVDPANPLIAKRPGAQSGLAWAAGPATVDRTVDNARRCPPTRAYSGDPYYAFLSDRRMPGNQPGEQLFRTEHAPVDAAFARRAAADQPRCP